LFYRIYPVSYEFQKFETYLKIDLNNSKIKERGHCCNGLHPLWRFAQPVKAAWPTWAFQPGTKQGSPPPHSPPARGSPAKSGRPAVSGRGGGARELALEVRVPTWCIGSRGAHRGGLAAAKQVSGGEPATASRRRGGGHWLGVHGSAVSSGGGHCSDGGARRWPEVALNGKVASANEGGGRLGASTGPCGGQWLNGRLGVAQRRMRVVHSGQRSVHGVEADGERQSGVGGRSAAVAGRGENRLLLWIDSKRRRRTGRWLHALRVEAGRLGGWSI
jgi:hypothetical protein